MLNFTRKSILILALASFTAMATGTTIFLHIISTEHHEHHDQNTCTICQHSLLWSKKAIIIPQTTIQLIEQFAEYVQFCIQREILSVTLPSFFSRGPPALIVIS
ncbi:MAG: hypothetical protein JW787_09505 [Sedimentisphaerales bacterium]|nr:hypothetical protein [Sedimentisphaerales bacterium]